MFNLQATASQSCIKQASGCFGSGYSQLSGEFCSQLSYDRPPHFLFKTSDNFIHLLVIASSDKSTLSTLASFSPQRGLVSSSYCIWGKLPDMRANDFAWKVRSRTRVIRGVSCPSWNLQTFFCLITFAQQRAIRTRYGQLWLQERAWKLTQSRSINRSPTT